MLLNRNSNGYFGYCEDCEEYHLLFNNLFMAFSEDKLNNFLKLIDEVTPEADIPDHEFNSGKNILLPITNPNMLFLVSVEELSSLKTLIFTKDLKNIF
tara:strand:- start:731 stop:1024 length:294 start_codon:yes stop_codon:yes gene_type:complete